MLYAFPYENLFVWGIGLLIVILLGLRVVITRKWRSQEPPLLAPNQKPPAR